MEVEDKKERKMQEVLKKIDELHSLLEEKLVSTDKLNERLSAQKLQLEKDGDILKAKDKHLKAKERIYSVYEDFEKEKNDFQSKKVNYSAGIKELEVKGKEIEGQLKKLEGEQVKLDERKLGISKQAIALKEKEANFDKKKQELKGLISGNTLKDILK